MASPDRIPHANIRHGEGWPKEPRSGKMNNWSGWLTHREYNVLDIHIRIGINNIFSFTRGESPGRSRNAIGCEKMFYDLRGVGLIGGTVEEFFVTNLGRRLFRMTDDYILQWDCGEEDEVV